jgi:hypothetical protein
MARFYMAFETMKNFHKIVAVHKKDPVDMKALLKVLCESQELQGGTLRRAFLSADFAALFSALFSVRNGNSIRALTNRGAFLSSPLGEQYP